MSPMGGARRLAVFVVGTRAQLIKVAPVIVACEASGLPLRLLMTGQHQETMDDLIREFGIRVEPVAVIPADERATVYSLLRWLPAAWRGLSRALAGLRSGGQGIDVLVHGDTLSTLLGAVAGWRGGDRVMHLESGLTSRRLFDPFPEEIVRRLVFRVCDVAYCPGPAEAALMRRFRRCEVVESPGNTILDAVQLSGAAARASAAPGDYVVASLHRFQNLYDDGRLRELAGLVRELAAARPVHFVLHPATRKRLATAGLLGALQDAPGVTLSPRLGYREFLNLAAGASCVLTDGGSNQEELAALGVPTIVMRQATERSDGLQRNAIMEADVPGGVLDYVRSGAHEALRRPVAALVDSPSQAIARHLGAGSA